MIHCSILFLQEIVEGIWLEPNYLILLYIDCVLSLSSKKQIKFESKKSSTM